MQLAFSRRSFLLMSVVCLCLGVAGWIWTTHDRPTQQLTGVGLFAFHPDGGLFVSTTLDSIGTWSWPQLQRMQTLPLPVPTDDTILALSGDGAWVARQSTSVIEIWRIADATRTTVIPGYPARTLYQFYLNQNGTALARVPRADGDPVHIWRLMNGVVMQEIPTLTAGRHLALSPDGQTIAFASERGIDLAQLNNQTTIAFWPLPIGRAASIASLAFSLDGRLLAVAPSTSERLIWIWRVTDGQLVATLHGYQDDVSSMAFSPDSTLLTAGGGNSEAQFGADTSVRVWRIRDGALIHTFATPSLIKQVAFSPDGKIVVANNWDSRTRFWALP